MGYVQQNHCHNSVDENCDGDSVTSMCDLRTVNDQQVKARAHKNLYITDSKGRE